jgi:hypothetical protein
VDSASVGNPEKAPLAGRCSFWRTPTRLVQAFQKDIYFGADSVDFEQIENTTQLDPVGRRVMLKLRPTKVENGRPFRPFLTLNAAIYKTTGEAQSKHGIPFRNRRPFVSSYLRRYLSEFPAIGRWIPTPWQSSRTLCGCVKGHPKAETLAWNFLFIKICKQAQVDNCAIVGEKLKSVP